MHKLIDLLLLANSYIVNVPDVERNHMLISLTACIKWKQVMRYLYFILSLTRNKN